jgi:hypothetical protein
MQVIETAPSITVLTPPNDGSHLLSLAGPASKTERVSKGIRLIRKEGQSPYEAPHIIPALRRQERSQRMPVHLGGWYPSAEQEQCLMQVHGPRCDQCFRKLLVTFSIARRAPCLQV